MHCIFVVLWIWTYGAISLFVVTVALSRLFYGYVHGTRVRSGKGHSPVRLPFTLTHHPSQPPPAATQRSSTLLNHLLQFFHIFWSVDSLELNNSFNLSGSRVSLKANGWCQKSSSSSTSTCRQQQKKEGALEQDTKMSSVVSQGRLCGWWRTVFPSH